MPPSFSEALTAKSGFATCGSVRLPPPEELGVCLDFIEGLEWSTERFDKQQPSKVWLSHAHWHSGSSGGTVLCITAFSSGQLYIFIPYCSLLAFHRTWSKPCDQSLDLQEYIVRRAPILNFSKVDLAVVGLESSTSPRYEVRISDPRIYVTYM